MKRPNKLSTWMKPRSAKFNHFGNLGQDETTRTAWFVRTSPQYTNGPQNALGTTITLNMDGGASSCPQSVAGGCASCWPNANITTNKSAFAKSPWQGTLPGGYLSLAQLKVIPMHDCDFILSLGLAPGELLFERLQVEQNRIKDLFEAARAAAAAAQTEEALNVAQQQFTAASTAVDQFAQAAASTDSWGFAGALQGFRETTREAVKSLANAKQFRKKVEDVALRYAAADASAEAAGAPRQAPPSGSVYEIYYPEQKEKWKNMTQDLTNRVNELIGKCGGMEFQDIITEGQSLQDEIVKTANFATWEATRGVISSEDLMKIIQKIIDDAKEGKPCSKSDLCNSLAISRYGDLVGHIPGMGSIACASACFDSPVNPGCPLGIYWKWYAGGIAALLTALILWGLIKYYKFQKAAVGLR